MGKSHSGKIETEKKPLKLKIKKHKINKWTENEKQQLLKLVRDKGENWKLISEYISQKTAKQCMQKFKHIQRTSKKGNWSKQEDNVLQKWVADHGPQLWTECSQLIKGRSGKQCRERWINTLNPNIKKGNWSVQEQELIYKLLLEHKSAWSFIANNINGRTENAIKNYFYSSMRRLKQNPIFHLLKDIYVNKKVKIEDIDFKNAFVSQESKKLNYLSRQICEILLQPQQYSEQDLLFFLRIIFGDEFQFDFQQQISEPQQQNQSTEIQQEQLDNSFAETSLLQMSFQQRGSSQSQQKLIMNPYEKECLIELLKRYAELQNLKNLHNFLCGLNANEIDINQEENKKLQIILHQLKI